MSNEKRGGARHDVSFHIVVDDGTSFNAGVVNDVSDTGLFLETALPLDIGTHVKLTTVDLGDGDPFTVEAEVVRIESTEEVHDGDTAGMGLRFVDLSSEQVEKFFEALDELAEQAARDSVDLDPYLSVHVPKRALSNAHLEVIKRSESNKDSDTNN